MWIRTSTLSSPKKTTIWYLYSLLMGLPTLSIKTQLWNNILAIIGFPVRWSFHSTQLFGKQVNDHGEYGIEGGKYCGGAGSVSKATIRIKEKCGNIDIYIYMVYQVDNATHVPSCVIRPMLPLRKFAYWAELSLSSAFKSLVEIVRLRVRIMPKDVELSSGSV